MFLSPCSLFWDLHPELFQKLFHIGWFQNLAHRYDLFVDRKGRHAHYAVCHHLLHIGDLFHFRRQPHCFYGFFRAFILFVTGFTSCAQDFDAANTVFCIRAAIICHFADFTCRVAAIAGASGSRLLFFLFLSEIEQCHNEYLQNVKI